MQNAWVLNQEILINPELYHPCPKRDAAEISLGQSTYYLF